DFHVTGVQTCALPILADLLGFANLDVTAAKNAELTINGVQIVSGSNTIKDVIEGVTLTLTKVTSEPATLTVSRDTSAARTAIQGFVDAYNAVQSTIANLTAYSADTQVGSVLSGDAVARSVQSSVRSIMNTV